MSRCRTSLMRRDLEFAPDSLSHPHTPGRSADRDKGACANAVARGRGLKSEASSIPDARNPVVMEICDFGTVGLGGPTRADRIPEGDERTDFIDLLRNVGSPRDVEHGGGTYGFGKAVLYRASRCRTILVDSLVTGGAKEHVVSSHPYRQILRAKWNGTVRPYTEGIGGASRTMTTGLRSWSRSLTYPPKNLRRRWACRVAVLPRAVPSIMILDFDLQEVTPETAGWRVVETLLWNFWPRMLSTTPEDVASTVEVEVEGRSLAIPEPEQTAPLHLFAKAMDAARTGRGEIVRSERPQKESRDARHRKGPLCTTASHWYADRKRVAKALPAHRAYAPDRAGSEILGRRAASRRPRGMGWVFLAAREREVERAFARAEPPAHDSWEPTNLPKGRAKSLVNVALTRLRRRATDMGQTQSPVPEAEHMGPPLARRLVSWGGG